MRLGILVMDEFELYHKRCRLCATEHQLGLNLFGGEGVVLDLKSKIKMYLSIDVCSEDELPKQVCYQCLYRIETFHSFKLSCVESEHTLRNWHLFYGGFAGNHGASRSESELPSTNETETVKIVSNNVQDVKSALSDGTRLSPSISVDSVAQPTTGSFSTLELAKMAEKAYNKQIKHVRMQSKIEKKTSTVESSFSLKTAAQKKHVSNSSGKVDIVAVKNGRNVVRISDDGQNTSPKVQSCDGDNEVSRFLLNMSGVGTISVTKFEGIGTVGKDVKRKKVSYGREVQEDGETNTEKQQMEEYVIGSDGDDDDESDGFSGFDFEDTSCVQVTEEYVKKNESEVLEDTVVVGEILPSECIQFEHLELDGNDGLHVSKNEIQKENKSDMRDPLRYMTVTVDSSGSTRFACMKCNKTFAQKSYIKEHMKIHTGEKPFVCTTCGRSFRNNYMLKVHFRLHTGEKNFKCDECGALFTERGALVSHSRTHTGIKPFVCKFCNRKFAQNPALKRHLRIHTKEKPYTCEHCEASFADRGTWRNHVRTHTGERPYDCTLCGKSFVQRTNLQAHIKTHTDERPFPCQVCDSSFRTKAHLVKHLSTIHRDVMKSVVTFMKVPKEVPVSQ